MPGRSLILKVYLKPICHVLAICIYINYQNVILEKLKSSAIFLVN